MSLINYEINLDLSWFKKCIIVVTSVSNQGATFSETDTKLYVPVVTLSNRNNAKLLKQLKSGLEKTINWNKYQSNVSIERTNQFLNYLIDPCFQGVNRLFILSFDDNGYQTRYKWYFLPTVEIKDYNVMNDRENFFDMPV